VPIAIGGDVGDSSANQTLDNEAESEAENDADVEQTGAQTQSSTYEGGLGSGGPGQFQAGVQNAEVNQTATSGDATANQDALNANVPIALFGSVGDSSANQTLDNEAESEADNDADVDQDGTQDQSSTYAGGLGSGGPGQFQFGLQNAEVNQTATSGEATANQDADNVNVPIALFGDVGDGSANQTLDNEAESEAENDADVEQTGAQTQSSAYEGGLGSGGPGQFQAGVQNAEVNQTATSGDATANQEADNVNVPIALFGSVGDSSANQTLDNEAESEADNDADVDQDGTQDQSSTYAGGLGSGGPGQFQFGLQNAEVNQTATSGDATADQVADNVNVPIALFGGGDDNGGTDMAGEALDDAADSGGENDAGAPTQSLAGIFGRLLGAGGLSLPLMAD
jgi:hypothetical protein